MARRLTSIADWELAGTPETHTDDAFGHASATVIAYRRGRYSGQSLSFRFIPTTDNGRAIVAAKIVPGGSYTDGIVMFRDSTKLKIFTAPGSVSVTVSGLPAVAAGVPEDWTVRVRDNHLAAWLGSEQHADHSVPHEGWYGDIALGVTAATIDRVVCDPVFPLPLGLPPMDDDALLGRLTAADGWNSGNYEDGGNSLNHPSRVALAYAYDQAVFDFVDNVLGRVG